jgi:hypothetical protein
MAKRPAKWIVCYIDSGKLHLLEKDLSQQPKYRSVKAYIPTVKVLKKKFKNKNHFEDVPLLFNYGFFEVPEYFIYNPWFLDTLKQDIRAIYGFVRDSSRINYDDGRILPYGKKLLAQNPSHVALASTQEIATIMAAENEGSMYSAKDIEKLRVGAVVTLHTYPFEGLQAKIVAIDPRKKEVEVTLLLQTHLSKIRVSFDNVFYTIYKSEYMNTAMKEQSIEEINTTLKYAKRRKKGLEDTD